MMMMIAGTLATLIMAVAILLPTRIYPQWSTIVTLWLICFIALGLFFNAAF